jgi:hypothetical protein
VTDARRIESCFVVGTPGNPANMRQTESRKTAVAGVLVAAVLAALPVMPAVGRTTTLD